VSEVRFTAAGIARGARASLPLVASLVPFAMVTGIAAQGGGFSIAEATLMSGLVYAGSSQLVALANWGHPPPLLGLSIATLAVNLRFALMGPVLGPWLDRLRGWRVWVSLFLMADQNWALSLQEMTAGGRDAGYLLGSGLAMWVGWVVCTAAGHALGAAMRPPPGHPIFFSALAVFVCMLATMWRGRRDVLPWAVAAAVATITARLVPTGAWYIVAGALAGSLAGAMRDRLRHRFD
jgi:predicted branched-subunit amino acid permease